MHELDFSTGLPAIAYAGELPWHGYGERLDPNADLDTWRRAAQLDWSVNEHPVYWRDNDILSESFGRHRKVDKKKALVRSDNNAMLSIVSDRYQVVQPEQVINFFDSLIRHYGFEMHTAGALRDGKRIWALADVGKSFNIKGDEVNGYFLLATSYDGTFSTTAKFTSIRVVCNNTLSWSLDYEGAKAGGVIKVPHSQQFDPNEIKADLGLDRGWSKFRDNVVQLSERKVTNQEAVDFFCGLLKVTPEEALNEKKQLINLKKLMAGYANGPGANLVTADGTAWGLVNAVTHFTDHQRRARNAGNRFDSAAFGGGDALKSDAMAKALELAA